MSLDPFSLIIGFLLCCCVEHAMEMHRDTRGGL